MKLVGLTGGIGSGKTTVCKIFESIGIPVYYADPRAKWLMNHHKILKSKLKKIFGREIYHKNGRLNRQKLADIIFNDEDARKKVNRLVHPAVHEDAKIWAGQQKAPYIIYEAALLIENGSYQNFDKLIVVTAPKTTRILRVMKRDRISRDKVEARIQAQLPQKKKDSLADFLIINDGTISLVQQVQKIHRQLIGKQ